MRQVRDSRERAAWHVPCFIPPHALQHHRSRLVRLGLVVRASSRLNPASPPKATFFVSALATAHPARTTLRPTPDPHRRRPLSIADHSTRCVEKTIGTCVLA
jgi:hypothetical protein